LALVILAFVVLAAGMTCPTVSQEKKPKKPNKPKKASFQEYIEQGTAAKAKAYYEEIQKELGFPIPRKKGAALEPTLDELLAYCGYGALRARDLERLPSDILMDFGKLATAVANPKEFAAFFKEPIAAGDLLCARFLSPKSTDVNGPVADREYTWRKMMRLRSRAGSEAAKRQIGSLFLLFNFAEKDLSKSPFGDDAPKGQTVHSKTNQAILVRAAGSPLKSSLYFFAFDSLEHEGRRMTYITSSWDVPTVEGPNKYYVPNSCAACHGGRDSARWMLNYVDTDHLFDRIASGDDFEKVGLSKHGVLFDAGKDQKAKQFVDAFRVIRQLNKEIHEQNRSVDAKAEFFMTRAVANWLRLHEVNHEHVPPFHRSIPGPHKLAWNADNSTDRELLPLLNRFCFRCHTSVYYHVFDKEAVVDYVGEIRDRLAATSGSYKMPQDRKLPDDIKKRFLALLDKLGE
jgi:hypothetical protein